MAVEHSYFLTGLYSQMEHQCWFSFPPKGAFTLLLLHHQGFCTTDFVVFLFQLTLSSWHCKVPPIPHTSPSCFPGSTHLSGHWDFGAEMMFIAYTRSCFSFPLSQQLLKVKYSHKCLRKSKLASSKQRMLNKGLNLNHFLLDFTIILPLVLSMRKRQSRHHMD